MENVVDRAMLVHAFPIVDGAAVVVQAGELHLDSERAICLQQDPIVRHSHENVMEHAIVFIVGVKVVELWLRVQCGDGIELPFHPAKLCKHDPGICTSRCLIWTTCTPSVGVATEQEVGCVRACAREILDLDATVTDERLRWAARVVAGIGRLVAGHKLDALTYYYYRDRSAFEDLGAILILGGSCLTAHGTPCAAEGDLKNAVAMFLLDRLDAGGSYTEFYAMVLEDQSVLMGHDDTPLS